MSKLMQLGDFVFDNASGTDYTSLKRDTTHDWAFNPVYKTHGQAQYVGISDSLSLSGVVYPHHKGGLKQLDTLRAEASKQEPLLLVDGLGNNLHHWVVLSVTEKQSHIIEKGAPLKQEFDLKLQRVFEP